MGVRGDEVGQAAVEHPVAEFAHLPGQTPDDGVGVDLKGNGELAPEPANLLQAAIERLIALAVRNDGPIAPVGELADRVEDALPGCEWVKLNQNAGRVR